MEAEGCTVTVSGLPSGLDEERLLDKLCIHFLRGRHGGGEISSVNIAKTTPASALVTFEDSKVAQSVVQFGKHVLSVDNKEYKLAVSFPRKEVDLDKVFTSMTVTVNYSRLPLGKEVVSRVQRSAPQIRCGFDQPAGSCTMSGCFSAVQATVSQLLGLLESPASSGTGLAGPRVSTAGKGAGASAVGEPSGGSAGLGRASGQTSPLNLERRSASVRRRGAQADDPPLQDGDHSLIVDIDAFRYLQRHCGKKYERILSRHGVEALDVTAGGVTTLLLQTAEGRAEGREGLRQAHRDLGRLCQEVGSGLCREQLLKESGPQQSLRQALEALQLRLPQVMLGHNAAGKHISIVGSGRDVVEAKRFLLDLRAEEEAARFRPRLGRAGLGPAADAPQPDASTGTVLNTSMGGSTGTVLKNGMGGSTGTVLNTSMGGSAGTGLKTSVGGSPEGGGEYRLAARIRDTKSRVPGLDKLDTGLGNTPAPSNAFKGPSSVYKRRSSINSSGPAVSSGQVSGKEKPGLGLNGLNLEDLRKSGMTGQEIPLEKMDHGSAASAESRPLLSSALTGSGAQVGSSPGTSQLTDPPGVRRAQTAYAPASTTRWADSLSRYGRDRWDQKAGHGSGSEEKPSGGKISPPGGSREERSVEVQARTVMWNYMKEVYRTRLGDILSGARVKEGRSNGDVTTIILTGAEPRRLNVCQWELRNLVTMVAGDFAVEELQLARLGVADPRNETLEICCAEVRSRFQNVRIQLQEDALLIAGPRPLCNQVVGALLEVFQGGAVRRQGLRESPAGAGGTPDTSLTNGAPDKETLPPQTDYLDISTLGPDGAQEVVTQKGEEPMPSTSEHSLNVQRVSGGGAQQESQSAGQEEPIVTETLVKAPPTNGKAGRSRAPPRPQAASVGTQVGTVLSSAGALTGPGPGSSLSETRVQEPEGGPSPDQV